MAKIGNLIAKRLKDIGQSPADLRRELERVGASVSRQSIHGWMSGRSRPSHDHLMALFDVLLVPESQQRCWHEARRAWTAPTTPEEAPTDPL